MNHQERMELLGALSRSGVSHYKSHDLEIRFGGQSVHADQPPKPEERSTEVAPPAQNNDASEKLKELIDTMKMDDASLLDKIFPAGAGL